jgi:hypothetical protein
MTTARKETLTLKQFEDQLSQTELYLDRYAHGMNSSTAPGERDYYEEKCKELTKQKRWLKFNFLIELRRKIASMKRRIANGEMGLKSDRNRLKREYFEVRG